MSLQSNQTQSNGDSLNIILYEQKIHAEWGKRIKDRPKYQSLIVV